MSTNKSEFGKFSLINIDKFSRAAQNTDSYTLYDLSCDEITNKNSILFFRYKYRYLSMDYSSEDIFFWGFLNKFENQEKRHPLFCDVSEYHVNNRDHMNRNASARPPKNIAGISTHTYNVFRSASALFYIAQVNDLKLAITMVHESNPRTVREMFIRAKKASPEKIVKISKQEEFDLIMSINRAKFSCQELNQKLLRTGLKTIFNVAPPNEKNNFLGITRSEKPSLNVLGKVLMIIRSEYQMSRTNQKDASMSYPDNLLEIFTSDDALFNIVDTTFIEGLEREFVWNSENETTRGERNDRREEGDD